MSHEERDSQLSAMFDDELPAGECELLARRLARDPALQGRWAHYAVIGACIRGQSQVRLPGQGSVADRVRTILSAEPAPGRAVAGAAAARERLRFLRPAHWLTPLAGLATAASVAAIAILWLRGQAPAAPILAAVPHAAAVSAPAFPAAPAVPAPASLTAQAGQAVPAFVQAVQAVPAGPTSRARSHEHYSYVVPMPRSTGLPQLMLPAEVANYQGQPAQYPGLKH